MKYVLIVLSGLLFLPVAFGLTGALFSESTPNFVKTTLNQSYASSVPSGADTFSGVGTVFGSNFTKQNANLWTQIAINNGSSAAVVADWALANASKSNVSVYGSNPIASNYPGTTGVKMVGSEIDIVSHGRAGVGSGTLYLNNIYGYVPGAFIQTGSPLGGMTANGFMCGGVNGTCLGLVTETHDVSSFINTLKGYFKVAAIYLDTNKNGNNQLIRFQGPTWNNRTDLYEDNANGFHIDNIGGNIIIKDVNGNNCKLVAYSNDTIKCRH